MTGEVLVVTATTLNLRDLPDAGAAILTVLPKGHSVRRLDDRKWNTTWLRIETDFNGIRYNGYLSGQYVAAPAAPKAISAVDLERQMLEGLKIYGRKTMQMIINNKRKALVASLAPSLAQKLPGAGVNTLTRLAHFFGQTALETDYYATLQEYATGDDYDPAKNPRKAAMLGNTQPGDGRLFKGRGMIQLTGRSNYTRASAGMGLGDRLVREPQLLATDFPISVDTALWYWTANNVNAVCDRAGTLESVSLAVSRAVNLGNPDSASTPHHTRERRLLTESALEAFAPLIS